MLEGGCSRPAAMPVDGTGTMPIARSLSRMLGADDRLAVQAITGSPQLVRAGLDLIGEGGGAPRILLIVSGWACRYTTTSDGSRQIVGLVTPGEFANLDMLFLERADYGVRAIGDVMVSTVSGAGMLKLADDRPAFARALTRLAFMDNAVLSQQAVCIGRRSALQRLAHLLCELAVRRGAGGGGRFDMPLTQEQLADALGLTSVHVNRTLQHLRRGGYVAIASRTMTITDADGLRALAGFDSAYLYPQWR